MSIKNFHEVFAQEVAEISKRRSKHGRPEIVLEQEEVKRDGTPVMRPAPNSNVVGLALSGGGIRSAAFCLGVLQALDALHLIKKIDYLSTVSGGGYIGTSMTVAMSTKGDSRKKNFPSRANYAKEKRRPFSISATIRIICFRRVALNIFGNVVVYLRGILANVVLLLPWLLLAAAVTIWLKPNVDALARASVAGHLLRLPVSARSLRAGPECAVGLCDPSGVVGDCGARLPGAAIFPTSALVHDFLAFLSVLILIIAFVELQPLLLSGIVKVF